MAVSPPWLMHATDEAVVARLAADLGISPITSRVLVNRKITTSEMARLFFQADATGFLDPTLLKDMDVAVKRILAAIHAGEKIWIYGDYDVDGAVATALLLWFFRDIGCPISFYIPNRLSEGYSLNDAALRHLKERGATLIVTVDNGITAHAAALTARSLGIDLIITDHHQVAETLPQAIAVVNPQRADCPYPFKGISGAGVAFKLMTALRQRLRADGYFENRPEPNLKRHLDLLCVATVCDCVPLLGENRLFVKMGLAELSRTRKPGLRALIKVSQLRVEASAADLGFRLGPRINACGRLEDASLGVKLLTTTDAAEAEELAQALDRLNQERQGIERDITERILKRVHADGADQGARGVVIYEPEAHLGVVGIVASRVAERLLRPVFVLCRAEDGLIKGSGRSVGGVSLIQALRACAPVLQRFGGHEAAAGVTLKEADVPAFAHAFDLAVAQQVAGSEATPTVWVDDVVRLADIDEHLLKELEMIEPCGMGNARPIFMAKDLPVRSKRIVGEDHLKLQVGDTRRFDAIAFKQANHFENIKEKISALFGLEINSFQNRERIQLVVKQFLAGKNDLS